MDTLDCWAGGQTQSVLLPQDCFCGFTLNPSPPNARQAEEMNIPRESRSYSKLNKHFAQYIHLAPAQQWGSAGGCELDCHPVLPWCGAGLAPPHPDTLWCCWKDW